MQAIKENNQGKGFLNGKISNYLFENLNNYEKFSEEIFSIEVRSLFCRTDGALYLQFHICYIMVIKNVCECQIRPFLSFLLDF